MRIKGFTLTEIMVTGVLMTLIVAFALPNYTKLIERGRERDAAIKLTMMRSAMYVWRTKNGNPNYNYATGDIGNWNNLDEINAALGTSIQPTDGVTYLCQPNGPYCPGGDVNCCVAIRTGNAWILHVHDHPTQTDPYHPHCCHNCLGLTITCISCLKSQNGGCPY